MVVYSDVFNSELSEFLNRSGQYRSENTIEELITWPEERDSRVEMGVWLKWGSTAMFLSREDHTEWNPRVSTQLGCQCLSVGNNRKWWMHGRTEGKIFSTHKKIWEVRSELYKGCYCLLHVELSIYHFYWTTLLYASVRMLKRDILTQDQEKP